MTKPGRLGLTLQHILVPTDFSEPPTKALRYARSFARHFGARITLLQVVEPLRAQYDDYPLSLLAQHEKGPTKAAKTLEQLCDQQGINPGWFRKPLVRLEAPAEEIAGTARVLPVDLIIIATHGYTGLKHPFVGSTTKWSGTRPVRFWSCGRGSGNLSPADRRKA